MSDSVRPHRQQPTRLPRPWDSPGKNTGVGCHLLLQRVKVKSEGEVAQSCLTLSDLMDCSPPGSSVHEILQARVLEWAAIAFSASFLTRNQTPGPLRWEWNHQGGLETSYISSLLFLLSNSPLQHVIYPYLFLLVIALLARQLPEGRGLWFFFTTFSRECQVWVLGMFCFQLTAVVLVLSL